MEEEVTKLKSSISKATTVKITGRLGSPVYHQCHLSDCEVLHPVGRWKFRFGNKDTRNELKLSPFQFVEAELRVGGVVVDCFRRHDVVTLHRQGTTSMTVTIAEVGANQLAVIAMLFNVSHDISRAAGLVQNGDSASLEHLIQILHYRAPEARLMFWSVGIPATIMSEVLFTNLIALPVPGAKTEASVV